MSNLSWSSQISCHCIEAFRRSTNFITIGPDCKLTISEYVQTVFSFASKLFKPNTGWLTGWLLIFFREKTFSLKCNTFSPRYNGLQLLLLVCDSLTSDVSVFSVSSYSNLTCSSLKTFMRFQSSPKFVRNLAA